MSRPRRRAVLECGPKIDIRPLRLRPYTDAPVPIGDLEVTPRRVRHTPRVVTHAFSIASPADERRLVVATDLGTWEGLLDLFLEIDERRLEPDRRAVAVGNHLVAVLIGGEELVVGVDGVGLARALELAFREIHIDLRQRRA